MDPYSCLPLLHVGSSYMLPPSYQGPPYLDRPIDPANLGPPLALPMHLNMPEGVGNVDTNYDTERATRTRPPEPPDSLTPLSELTQPIDPDAADRGRYMTTDEARIPASPHFRSVRGGAHARPIPRPARRFRHARPGRLTGFLTAPRHYGTRRAGRRVDAGATRGSPTR